MKNRVLQVCILLCFWYPLALGATSLLLLGLAVHFASGWLFAAAVLNLYVTPVVSYRVFHALYPIHEGRQLMWPIREAKPSAWLVGHKIQLIYAALPGLERVLVLVPGLYAAWLRLWGAKVGPGVFFSPQFEAIDRGLVEIGENCFFGHRVFLSSHVLRVRDGRYILYVKRIKIGDESFIGAMSNFGPGTDLPAGTYCPLGSYTLVNDTEPRSAIPEGS